MIRNSVVFRYVVSCLGGFVGVSGGLFGVVVCRRDSNEGFKISGNNDACVPNRSAPPSCDIQMNGSKSNFK